MIRNALSRTVGLLAAVVLAGGVLAGCEDEPEETMEDATEETGEAIEETGEEMDEAVEGNVIDEPESAGEVLEGAADVDETDAAVHAVEEAEEAGRTAGEAVEQEAGEVMRETGETAEQAGEAMEEAAGEAMRETGEAAEQAGRLQFASSVEDLVALAAPKDQLDDQGYFTVGYDVPDRGFVPEVRVCRVKNGISANYLETYMRRRDPDCMVIGDEMPSDKVTFSERFGKEFGPLREETFEWLETQDLAMFAFEAGRAGLGKA